MPSNRGLNGRPVDDAIDISGASSMASFAGRQLPSNADAEDSVLGAMLLSPDAMQDILTEVKPSDFYRLPNRIIFVACTELFDRGMPVDQVTLMDYLRTKGELERAGGAERILDLGANTLALANWPQHAEMMRRDSILRQIITASTGIVSLAFDWPGDTKEVVERAEKMLLDVTNQDISSDYSDMGQIMIEVSDQMAAQMANPDGESGVKTGFPGLDSLLMGLRPGQMVVVGARPGVGKTSLGLNLATNAARTGTTVAFFSLEMSKLEVGQRLLSSEAKIPLSRIRSARIAPEEQGAIIEGASTLAEMSFMVDDTPGTTVTEIRAKARRMLKGCSNGLIIVDYLQLLSTPAGRRSDNRATEVGEMSRGIKIMAKDLGVPVIALSQLNRQSESRTERGGRSKRPQLSDLRESGSIEQDADIVILLDRSMTEEEAEREDRPDKDVTDFIVAKNRSGPLGTVHCMFLAEMTKFVELDTRYDE